MIGDLWCLVKLRFTLIPFYLDPVLELPILLVEPRYIQSAILIATTLLYHLNMIFTVATKQFTIFHPPPWGAEKFFRSRMRHPIKIYFCNFNTALIGIFSSPLWRKKQFQQNCVLWGSYAHHPPSPVKSKFSTREWAYGVLLHAKFTLMGLHITLQIVYNPQIS